MVLTSTAYVKQVQFVEAVSKKAAETLARSKKNDNVWEYDGLTDDEFTAVTVYED